MILSKAIYFFSGIVIIVCRKLYLQKKAHHNFLEISSHLHPSIITFDIHGVMFQLDHKKILHLICTNKTFIITIIGHCLYPPFIKNIARLICKRAVPEEYIMKLSSLYPRLLKYKPLAIEFANAQKPVPSTIELIYYLKNQGYTLHIFSNIGEIICADLIARHPNLFAQFDYICVPSAKNNYCGKPRLNAYKNYVAGLQQNKTILFIDNSLSNIITGNKFNMIGIHYRNSKQLIHDLKRCNIISDCSLKKSC